MDYKKDFKVEEIEGSKVKITGEIPYEEIEKQRSATLKALGKHTKVDGFREGHVPEAILAQKFGELPLLTEMAERALALTYPEIVKAHELDVIGAPKIEITKIALQNPLGFTATVHIMPTIKLADYKKIAKTMNGEKVDASVTDAEVEEQIKTILRSKAAYERLQKKAAAGEKETHTHSDGTIHEGPAHDEQGRPLEDINDLEIAELTDEVVKTLGQPGQFENVDDFRAKIREHLGIEKKREVEGKRRAALTDKVIEESQFELPEILLESELNQMFAQMEEDIKRAGLTMDDYLSHMKKTRDDLKKEWSPTAEKRARLQLVLNEIAKAEKIEPEKERLEEETKHLLEHYQNADPVRVRVYVASVLQNEAVMKFLESQ